MGSLVTLMAMAHLQRGGHAPIALLGGATGLIGDPSGRDSERIPLDPNVVANNCEAIGSDAMSVLGRASDPAMPQAALVNNARWYESMPVLEFLGTIGSHFRVPTMLRRESVARRMESQEGISFTEFSYQLLQSHDFYHLRQHLGVGLQIGGSDQWGNITAGIDYAKRRGIKEPMAGITTPLLETKDGQKLGKSAGNAVWLSERKTSHFDLYQYFVQNATDEKLRSWMSLLTMMPMEEIEEICANNSNGHAQHMLAFNVVALVRGQAAAESAKLESEALFQKTGNAEPNAHLTREKASISTLVEICVELNVSASKAEAKRLIEQGGLYVNEKRIENISEKLSHDIQDTFELRAGKKKRFLVKID